MRELTFADLGLLRVLVPVFLLWLAAWSMLSWMGRWRAVAAVRFSNIRRLERLKPSRTLLMRRLVMGLRVLSVALLIMAMARPQTGRKHTQVLIQIMKIRKYLFRLMAMAIVENFG